MDKKLFGFPAIWQLSVLSMLMFFFLAPATYAQSFDMDEVSDPTEDYIVGTTTISAKIIDIAGFSQGDIFYFYYGDQFNLDENRIIQQRSYPSAGWPDNERTFTGTINETGTWNLYVGHFTGRFDYETQITSDDVLQYMGGGPFGGFLGYFSQSGNRFLITNPFDFSGENEGDVDLRVDFWFMSLLENNAIVVEYSINNGSTWTKLEDTNGDDTFFGTINANRTFELPPTALNSNTQFRVRQLNSIGLGSDDQWFYVDFMFIYKGTPIAHVTSEPVGTYIIQDEPLPPPPPVASIAITAIEDEDGAAINAGNRTLPGDEITVKASTTNIDDLDAVEYFVELNGNILSDVISEITTDQDNNEVEIDFLLPADIPDYYGQNRNIRIIVAEDDEVIFSVGGINENFINDYDEEQLQISGGVKDGSKIDFTLAGPRHFTTPVLEEEIITLAGATLTFSLARLSSPIPGAGNEIVLEYTTNGDTWTQIGEDILLGGPEGVGQSGEFFFFDETDLTGIESASTQFRLRQINESNGAGIHTWMVEDFIFNIPGSGGNVVAISPNFALSIGTPSFQVRLADLDNPPIYPGSTLELEFFDIAGEFPDYVLFEVFYGDIWLKTLDELDDFSIVIPLDQGFKTLTVRADVKATNISANTNFTIQPVTLSIPADGVSFNFEDDGTFYSIPGGELSVTYEMSGIIFINDDITVSVLLQVENEDNEWETIAVQEIDQAINDAQGGIITGILPQGYDYGATTNIRIFLENHPWEEGQYRNKAISRAAPAVWSPGDGYTYYHYGSYNTFMPGSKIGFQIFNDGEFEGDLELAYYPNSLPWEPIEGAVINVTAGMTGYTSHYANMEDFVDMPDEVVNGSINYRFGVRHDENLSFNSNLIRGLRIIEPRIAQQSIQTRTINIIYPSLTLETLSETNFFFGEQLSVNYSSFGIDEDAEVQFAVVLEQNEGTADHVYHVLAEGDDLEGILTFNFPTREQLLEAGFADNDPNDETVVDFDFALRMYAYTTDIYDELFVATIMKNLDVQDDFLEVAGYNDTDNQFNLDGDRFAITRALDLSEMPEPVTLIFNYEANIPMTNLQRLPYLQVSVDGGVSYTTLTVEGHAYSAFDRLPPNGAFTFEVPIDEEFITAETHFRWKQDVTVNSWWTISNISITSGVSNLVPFTIEYLPFPHQVINLDEDVTGPYDDLVNLNAYHWQLVEEDLDELLEPAIIVGQPFTFKWNYRPDLLDEDGELDPDLAAGEAIWPEGTVFQFFILWDNPEAENPGANDEVENYFMFASINELGDLILADEVLPDILETGDYTVYVRAYVLGEEGEVLHGSHGSFDADDVWEDQYPLDNRGGVLVINATTIDFMQLTLINPEGGESYMINEEFDMEYATFGNWEGYKFAVVIRADQATSGAPDFRYEALMISEEFGPSVILEQIEMIGFPWADEDGDLISSYHLGIAAFVGDAPVFQDVDKGPLDKDDDFLVFTGADDLGEFFNKEGNRVALTRAMDLSGLENITLNFAYESQNFSTLTVNNLPWLQVSVDAGATFQNMVVEQSAFGQIGALDANADGTLFTTTYSVAIPEEFVTEATHFRWIQNNNFGEDKDEWKISNITIQSGVTNVIYADYAPVTLTWPSINNYEWSLVKDENDLDPIIYNGSTFEYSWEILIDPVTEEPLTELPEGTLIEFILVDESNDPVLDPATGDIVSLGTVSEPGVYTATIPFLLERGTYTVHAFATYEDMPYEDGAVGAVSVFKSVLLTIYNQGAPVLFAGNEADFSAELQNTVNVSAYDEVWFNLILHHDDKQWLLDAQQGLGDNFVVNLPPFVSGTKEFVIKGSLDNPMGVVGLPLESMNDESILSGTTTVSGATGSMGQVVEEVDLIGFETIKFGVKFSEPIENLTDDQKMVFSYSVDGGITFTHIHTYPDERFVDPIYFDNEDLTDFFREELTLPEGARTANTILRWRVEESKGTVQINDVVASPFAVDYFNVPLYYASTHVDIAKQRIDIISTDALSYCSDALVDIEYNIRGQFGEDAMLMLMDESNQIGPHNFGWVGSGSGQTSMLSANLEGYPAAVASFNIQLNIPAASFSPGNFLRLQYRNASTGFNWVNIEGVEFPNDDTPNSGVTYNQFIVLPFEVLAPNTSFRWAYDLSNWINVNNFTVKSALDIFPVGDGVYTLDLGMFDMSGTNIKFRLDAMDNTVAGYEFGVQGNFSELGIDVLEVNTNVTLSADPEKACAEAERLITIHGVQRNFSYELLNFVTGAALHDVVVADPDDEDLTDDTTYPYYNEMASTLTINIGTIDQLTRIEVLVSALTAEGDLCEAIIPDYVLDVKVRDHFALFHEVAPNVWSPVEDEAEFVYCGSGAADYFSIGYYDSDGSFVQTSARWYRVRHDETELFLGNYMWFDNFSASGTYIARFDDGECGMIEYAIHVTINEKPDQPAITINGESLNNVEICFGSSVVLEATEGFPYYRWYRGGSVVFGNNQSITVTQQGVYRVEVSNVPFGQGCPSDQSQPVNVIVNDIDPVWFSTNTINLCPDGDGIADVTVYGLEQDVTYSLVNNLTGEVVATFASSNWTLTFHTAPILETAQFSVHAVHDITGCSKIVSNEDNPLNIVVLPEFEILVRDIDNVYVPAGGQSFCEGVRLAVGTADGNLATGGSIRWYRDDLVVSTTNTYLANEPGVYKAKWTHSGEECTYFTAEVVVGGQPERPVLTHQGSLEFCEGSGDLVLVAPAGFAKYTWYLNGSVMGNVETTDNELHVVMSGEYRVSVTTETGCESDWSLPVDAVVHVKPATPVISEVFNSVLCEPGVVQVMLGWNVESDAMYQLYNVLTGEPTGQARMGQNNLILESDIIDHDVILEVRAHRLDVQGCGSVSAPFNIYVYNLTIFVSGNTLTASVPMYNPSSANPTGAVSYQWYRNGQMVINGGTNRSLNIYDDAAYTVVVETIDGCVLEYTINKDNAVDPVVEEVLAFNIFPNPVQDQLTVRFGQLEGQVQVRIVNLAGQIVQQMEFNLTEAGMEETLNLYNLEGGVYMIHVTGSEHTEVKRFIKK